MTETPVTYDAGPSAVLETIATANQSLPPLGGYRPPPRYREIRAAPGSMWDGGETGDPLTATIVTSLRGGELEWFRWTKDRAFETNDRASLHAALAPYVTAWNVMESTFDAESGELVWAPLPPPAEAGPAVFERVDILTVVWLAVQVAEAPTRLGEAPKPPSAPSDPPPDGADSETPHGKTAGPSPTRNRRSPRTPPTSSGTPTAST